MFCRNWPGTWARDGLVLIFFFRGMMSRICLDPAPPSARVWGVLGSSLAAEAERRSLHLPMDCRLQLDATRDITYP
jgi:hypothetical protein